MSSNKEIFTGKSRGDANKDDNSTLYNRIMLQERKKDYLLTAIRNQKEQEEMQILQDRPKLTTNSKKIIKEQFQHIQPIHTRVDDIISEKQYQMNKLKR